jgi:hypothetical protein
VSPNHCPPVRLFPKLAGQLVPAAVVTALGALLLGNLSKTPGGPSAAAPVPVAITAEAVFTATPRSVEEQRASVDDAVRPPAKPKTVAPRVAAPPRKLAEEPRQVETRQTAAVGAPLVIVPSPPQGQAAAPESTMMGRVWGATTAVAELPVRAAQSVTGWFSAAIPPRPPAAVPLQEFQAAM